MNEILLKRIKSFAWRFACIALIAGLSWVVDNLGIFDLPVFFQTILGLMLAELTKWLNKNQDMFGLLRK